MTDLALLQASYETLKRGTLWASTGRCKGFALSNPGEAAKIDGYVAALLGGQTPAAPVLATATGKGIAGLIASGVGPAPAPPPDPVPVPASGYLNDLGEFGRPAKDWAVPANWLPDSARLLGILTTAADSAVVALSSYGVAFFHASATDPVMTVRNLRQWGTTPSGGSFRCPSSAQPATGDDMHLVSVQPDGSAWELYEAVRTSALSWDANAVSYAAPGVYSYPLAGCRGSSFTLASGCLTPEDVSVGRIGHAVGIILPAAATRRAYMWPSTDTDGELADGIPEGARIVLDPGADLSALTGITKLYAQALKAYGALVIDKTGGSDISFPAIAPQSWTSLGQTSPWVALGLSGYPNLGGLIALLPKCRIENQPIKVKA